MVNNYPEYAAGISYQKAEENVKHFYNAQVKADPSDDSMSAVLTKDGEIISELPGGGGGESDFSTAVVKIKVTLNEALDQQYRFGLIASTMPSINDSGSGYFTNSTQLSLYPNVGDTILTFDLTGILYKGNATIKEFMSDIVINVYIGEETIGSMQMDYVNTTGDGNYNSTNDTLSYHGDTIINFRESGASD